MADCVCAKKKSSPLADWTWADQGSVYCVITCSDVTGGEDGSKTLQTMRAEFAIRTHPCRCTGCPQVRTLPDYKTALVERRLLA